MEELKKTEDHMQSAVAFVEGGIQEACDDSCSICLEAFCESDPSTLTSCKHEFHLQCVLEWCQRSSNCPMCWQAISLKDPSSQELLEAVERERSIRATPARSSAIFHHPSLSEFELQHLPVGASDAELEDRIIQHLAAAAAMGRARRIARREGPRSRSSAHSRPQVMVFSNHPNSGSVSSSLSSAGGESEPPAVPIPRPSIPLTGVNEQMPNFGIVQSNPAFASGSESPTETANRQGTYMNNRHSGVIPNQDRAGPSDLQSSLESLKTRFNAMSMRYKETITKSTRGWRDRLFSRNTSMDGLAPETRRDSGSGIANISHMMEHLQATREDEGADGASPALAADDSSATDQLNRYNEDTRQGTTQNESNTGAIAAGSASN